MAASIMSMALQNPVSSSLAVPLSLGLPLRNPPAFQRATLTPFKRGPKVVCAFGDVSSEGTTYLIAGAVAIALVGSAFPILFSRKDLCPECDGAGFVRKPGTILSANAARKDLGQIVCPRCKGLGKLGQVDK